MKHITATIFNDAVAAIITLVEHFNIPLTRTSIRETFLHHPNYPNLRLNDIFSALSCWNLEPVIYKADEAKLREADLPVLVHLSACKKYSGLFVVLMGIDNDEVRYVMPNQRTVTESLTAFLEKWSGFILAIDPAATNCEAHYAVLRKKEKAARATYHKSMKVIDDFLSADACQYIIDHCTGNNLFRQSEVTLADTNEDIISSSRTSSSAVINKQHLPFFPELMEKTRQSTGATDNLVEVLQCVKYCNHQAFDIHFDGDRDTPRKYTILVYLNDDFEGGTTWFPELGIEIQPKKGRALLFPNIDEDRYPLLYSAHAGTPVTQGTKYALNIWIKTTS